MRWRYSADDEDRNWDWLAIYADARQSERNQECYAAWAQNELQGLMIINLGENAPDETGWITIDYLATNPANRTVGSGLKYVGMALVTTAVGRSFELGLDAKIRLESLPGAENFYEGLGMTKQKHFSEEGNAVYIFEPEAAKQLLEEIRRRRILEV